MEDTISRAKITYVYDSLIKAVAGNCGIPIRFLQSIEGQTATDILPENLKVKLHIIREMADFRGIEV